MKMCRLPIFLALLVSVGFSQGHGIAPFRRADLPTAGTGTQVQAPVQGTFRILAIRVEFKADTDPRTTGDGKFALVGATQQFDPPPHDSAYFASKLRFLENYFAKASNGLVTVQADLFTPVVTLQDSMGAYSPGVSGSSQPLGKLIVDSWTATNDSNSSFPFSQYQAFVIFHAGVGRDINIVNILGFDPTPFDIPSVYAGLGSIQSYLANPTYQGVPVNGGTFRITNSMIIPETETRVFVLGSRRDTLQLSINGLLASSLGSYFGLPDLFDTKTGRSGIGGFGLMDGAGIFAYNGLFPPEPSAWEKVYLGWATPVTIATGTQAFSLPAVGLTTADTVVKIPITGQEYFLVENRSRDPLGNGQTLTLYQNGSLVTRHYGKDSSGFFFNDLRGITGSLVDVEDLDWAISGDMNQAGFEGGGILIWHVDETIIRQRLAANQINADPDHRGVDLEEADGSQDIGQSYDFLEPGSGTETGWPLDAWFQGNQTPIYRNAFDETSFPNSKSNTGARSTISIREFGPKAARMSLKVSIGDNQLSRLFARFLSTGTASNQPTITDSAIFVGTGGGVYAFRKDGSTKTSDPNGVLSLAGTNRSLAVDSPATHVVGTMDSLLLIWSLSDVNSDGIFDNVSLQSVNVGSRISSDPMIIDSLGTALAVVGTANGNLVHVQLGGTVTGVRAISTSPVQSTCWIPPEPGFPLGSVYAIAGDRIIGEQTSVQFTSSLTILPSLTAAHSGSGTFLIAGDGFRIVGYDRTLAQNGFEFSSNSYPGQSTIFPAQTIVAGDVDADGGLDALMSGGNHLYAVNRNGALLDGFPVKRKEPTVVGQDLVAETFGPNLRLHDLDGDGRMEIFVDGGKGELFAFDSKGLVRPGFPIQLSPSGQPSLALFRTDAGKVGILSLTENGFLQAWELNATFNASMPGWTQHLGNARHTNVNTTAVATPQPLSQDFLPLPRVYNWPNPVYGKTTQIRYYTATPAQISVKIFDIAGASVAALSGTSPGGLDSELTWDVSGIQSGVYLARVEAVAGGRSEFAIIKIAVIK